VTTIDVLDVAGNQHLPMAAHDHVHLLRVLMRVGALLCARRNVDPRDGKVASTEIARVHEEMRAEPASFFHLCF
jgi:hypothetical protein